MLSEGIYLRVKKSVRGTGHTTRVQSSRFFYALRPAGPDKAEICLLDENEKLRPTGLVEQVPWSETKDLQHVPKLQPFFEKLKPALGQVKVSAPPPEPDQPAASQAKAKPKEPEKEKEAGWWDMTSPGADGLGKKVF